MIYFNNLLDANFATNVLAIGFLILLLIVILLALLFNQRDKQVIKFRGLWLDLDSENKRLKAIIERLDTLTAKQDEALAAANRRLDERAESK